VTNLIEADVRQALMQTEGNLSWAAARCKVTRTELTMFIDAVPSLKALVTDLQEEFDDEAESELGDAIIGGQQWAVCYCLNSLLGRKRGYGKPLSASEEAAVPKPTKLPLFFECMKNMTEKQKAAMDRLMTVACGGKALEAPAHFQRLYAAGDAVRSTLAKHRGNLSRAAKQLGVSRSELKEYLTEELDLETVAADLREELIDEAESSLRGAMRNKKPWAIKFRLQQFSQGRGYSKYPRPPANPQPSIPTEFPARLDWNWDRLSNDELEEMRQIAEDLGIDPRKTPNPFAPTAANSRPDPSPKRGGEKVPDSIVGRVESSRPAVPATPVSRDAESSERSASALPAPNPSPGSSPKRGGEEDAAVEHVANVLGNSSTLATCSAPEVDYAPNSAAKRDEDAAPPKRGGRKEPYQPTPSEFAEMKTVLSHRFSAEVVQNIVEHWADLNEFIQDLVLKMMRSETANPSAATPVSRDAESSERQLK
jgi:Bacterial regulatory protein, Fis family